MSSGQVLERLHEAKLTIKLETCDFFQPQTKYLGYHVSAKGISCDNSFRVNDCPRPNDEKNITKIPRIHELLPAVRAGF